MLLKTYQVTDKNSLHLDTAYVKNINKNTVYTVFMCGDCVLHEITVHQVLQAPLSGVNVVIFSASLYVERISHHIMCRFSAA